jgi:deoxyribodipyrimidine photo-lyase
MSEHSLVWFRQDLRIQDNPALAAAASAGLPVIALFIFAPEEEAPWSPGGASKWWLHHALASLAHELATLGVPLVIRRGKSLDVLRALADEFAVTSVFWNRRYEPAIIDRDTAIKQTLKQQGVYVHSFNGSLLFEPEQIRNQSGKPFRVFTPFWKHLRSLPVEMPVHVAEDLLIPPVSAPESVTLESLGLLPAIPWDKDFYHHWDPSRKGAKPPCKPLCLIGSGLTKPAVTCRVLRALRSSHPTCTGDSSGRARYGRQYSKPAPPTMRAAIRFSARSPGGNLPTTCSTIFPIPPSSH